MAGRGDIRRRAYRGIRDRVLLLLACTDPPPPAEPPAPAESAVPPHQVLPGLADAVRVVLGESPRVLGVGEAHATIDGPPVKSAMARFTSDALPVLAPRTTDLVLETWRLDGRCGAQEEQVAAKVETETKRPEATKSELVLLVEAAVAANVRPHDLALSCDEYAALLDPQGEVVYGALLKLLTGKLGEFAVAGMEKPDASLVLYGGAVHNDLTPGDGLADYTYGPAAAAKGAYTELDLYVPEVLRATPSLVEPAWAPLLDQAGPHHVILFPRGPRSWVVLLETTPPP